MRLPYQLFLSFLLLSATFASASAQKTGSFDTTITFLGSTRLLSCYAPPKYSYTNKYRLMVCLHGLGDNAANYRNTLIGPLAWPTHFPNTIFVCPEAATTTADFYQSDSDATIVDSCIRFAMSNYHIDSADVILQGFSLGGRAALRYGLEYYAKFKALLLNTPAIQGVMNALNEQPTYLYEYQNASHIPIYITHGELDPLYEPPIDSARKLMIEANGTVRYIDIPGIGHTIPNFSQMSDVLSFFDSPARTGNATELFEVDAPLRITLPSLSYGALVQNVGSDTVTSLHFAISQGAFTTGFAWQGSMPPFGHDSVIFPALFVESGSLENVLDVRIDSINGMPNTFTAGSEKVDTFQYFTKGQSLPMSEGFEENTFPPPGWLLDQAGDAYSPWFPDTVRKSGQNSVGAFNTVFIFDNEGRAEGLVSPVLDLTSEPSPHLSFDLAYNYDRYTPPYTTGGNVDLTDTLDILISTDGGMTYTSIFRKAGAALATFAEPIINPLSLDADFIHPADSNWHHYDFDLSKYTTAPEASIKFNYISGLGGSIYIDNVSVSGPLAVHSATPVAYRVFPNPATDWVTIVGNPGSLTHVNVMDIAGREVLSANGITDGSGEFTIDTRALMAGIYFIRTTIGEAVRTEKLFIQH